MKILNRRIRCVVVASLVIASIVASSRAQQPAATQPTPVDRVALYQALIDLTNPWTVMCVAAHPDDEDGTSLIVMRRKYGAHTVSLFSTFGEGGQNAIGPELYEELGAIRARETMAASEIQGSLPYFLGLRDFGFSKSRNETFQKWGPAEALRLMVLQIRKRRPDVIITNHSTTSNDHGHHQATARLVVDAFDAAADGQRFPEQLTGGITTWQVQRLFVRVRGSQAPPADAQLVTIDPNERDPVRGTLFAEQALSALQKHATQGPWPKTFAEFTARFRAFSGQGGVAGQMPLIRYRLEREATGTGALPKDSHNFIDGLKLTETEASEVSAPTIDGRPLTDFLDQPARIIDALEVSWQRARQFLGPIPRNVAHNKARMSVFVQRTNRALAVAHGIATSLIGPEVLSPGTLATFTFVISNNGANEITLVNYDQVTSGPNFIALPCCPAPSSNAVVRPGQTVKIPLKYSVPNDTRLTVPHSAHLYDGGAFGTTVSTGVPTASTGFWIGANKWVDVAPRIEVKDVNPALYVFTPNSLDRPLNFRVRVVNHGTVPFRGNIATRDSIGNINESNATFTLAPNESREVSVQVRAIVRPPPHTAETSNEVTFSIHSGGSEVTNRVISTDYVHAQVTRNLRVGYIRGFDFSLPNALNALGVESKELTVDEVKSSDLSKYSSIIVDNRVYESQPDLIAANQKLLDYAQAGGNLIVFYHRIDEFNPNPQRNRPQLAPYKLILGNERITDENAPITFIEPDHPLLNSPNKLTQDDFKDWIQERGLYYPREWDPQFKALLQSNDPGEAPLKGGLLVADYGQGHYIYTSMVWYRQLRAGVPGAYRMLANMISYGQK